MAGLVGDGEGDYVQVEWGPDFALQQAAGWPGQADPGLVVSLGPLGLGYILEAGGSGYFRLGAIRPHLRSGRLVLVPDAPEFLYPAYAVHTEAGGNDAAMMRTALAGLRHVAHAAEEAAATGEEEVQEAAAAVG